MATASTAAPAPPTASAALLPSQAARELGVSVQRVRQFMQDGRLRATWTPYGRLIDALDVAALAAERERQRRGQPPEAA